MTHLAIPALSEWRKLIRRHFTTTLNTTAVDQAAETVSGPAEITVKAMVDDGNGQNGLQQQHQARTIDERRHSHAGQRIQGKVVQGLVPC